MNGMLELILLSINLFFFSVACEEQAEHRSVPSLFDVEFAISQE